MTTIAVMIRACWATVRRDTACASAYVLMGNHVHPLVSSNASGKVPRAMRQLDQTCVTAFDRRHRRSETLCEGRSDAP